jgi:hypothetical protein
MAWRFVKDLKVEPPLLALWPSEFEQNPVWACPPLSTQRFLSGLLTGPFKKGVVKLGAETPMGT